MTTETIDRPTTEIASRARSVLLYDSATGVFTNATNRGKNMSAGRRAGYVMGSGYVLLSLDGKRIYGHRMAWLMTHGCWPVGEVDHINGDKSDNRIANLRDVPKSINMQNLKRAPRSGSTGFLGVTRDNRRGCFVAQICIAGRHVHLGQHSTAEAAHSAYLNAKRANHEGNTL